ncbi:SpoIIE family protein phosphatase [Streptomyces sp. NPDC001698]|uniref:SpoIIE family protein phosphatase n=1 Tax=unclassified Streptomyces TaxID=2593676 RepID=UPI00368EEA3D
MPPAPAIPRCYKTPAHGDWLTSFGRPDVPGQLRVVIGAPPELVSAILYTDGLIERRDTSMDQALGQLLAAASRPVDDLENYLDHLLSCDITDTNDDTCLIAVQPT